MSLIDNNHPLPAYQAPLFKKIDWPLIVILIVYSSFRLLKYLPFFEKSPIPLSIEDYKILSLFLIELIVTILAISLLRYRPDHRTLSLHLLKLVPVIIFSVLLLKYIPFALSGMNGEQLMYMDNLTP